MTDEEECLLNALDGTITLINVIGDYHACLDKSGDIPQLVVKAK